MEFKDKIPEVSKESEGNQGSNNYQESNHCDVDDAACDELRPMPCSLPQQLHKAIDMPKLQFRPHPGLHAINKCQQNRILVNLNGYPMHDQCLYQSLEVSQL